MCHLCLEIHTKSIPVYQDRAVQAQFIDFQNSFHRRGFSQARTQLFRLGGGSFLKGHFHGFTHA